MSKKGEEDFYVGYMKTAPADLGKVLRGWIVGLLVVSAALAAMLMIEQRHFSNGTFEFGDVKEYQGVVRLDPVPIAMAAVNTDASNGSMAHQYFLLVNVGKIGAGKIFEDHEGEPVKFQATRIYRDGQEMLEVVPGSIERVDVSLDFNFEAAKPLGEFSFMGEIVDSKCHLGVMSPGNLKTHKACAIRCISGGIPPVLVVREKNGTKPLYLFLTGPNGEAMNDHVLDLIAEPVVVTGQAVQQHGFYFLRAAPEAIVRKSSISVQRRN